VDGDERHLQKLWDVGIVVPITAQFLPKKKKKKKDGL
jgi:hypothetical protein